MRGLVAIIAMALAFPGAALASPYEPDEEEEGHFTSPTYRYFGTREAAEAAMQRDLQYVDEMATHHRGAVVMSRAYLDDPRGTNSFLQRMAAAGELGTLLQIEANFSQDKFLSLEPDNWRMSQTEAPAGPMTATGIHLLDLAVGLLGPAQQVYARVRQLGSRLVNGDTLGILVTHKSGANSLISAVLATPFDGRFAVYGNRAWAEVRDKAHPEAPEGWVLTVKRRNSQPRSISLPPAKAVLANLEAFADAAAGRAPYPVPQEQMIANVCALEAVLRSALSGKAETVEN